jgi:TonB family protein
MKSKFTKSFIISLGLHLVFLTSLALFISSNSEKIDTFINIDIFHFPQSKVRPRKNIIKEIRPILTHEESDLLNRRNFRDWASFQANTLSQGSVATTVVTKSGDDSSELIQGYGIRDILIIPSSRIIRMISAEIRKIAPNRSNLSQIAHEVTFRPDEGQHRLPGLHSILTSMNRTESRINPIYEFLEAIRRKIENAKMYPHWAREAGYEGITKIRFAILSNGQLGEISIVGSSGYDILDNAAIAAIEKAAPFPALPGSLNRDILKVELPIVFKLNLES